MAAPGPFPLLVQGSWGADPPKNLSIKLQMYFQSQKRSGGGECEVRPDPGSPGRFLVLFFPKDVRQNVLERENHELTWPGKETFKLTVQLPAAPDEVHDISVGEIPTKEFKTKEHAKEPGSGEPITKVQETMIVQEDFNPRSKQKDILVVGSKAKDLEEMSILKQARDSVCIKNIHTDKPEASQFSQDKAQHYQPEVKKSYDCFEELVKNEEKEEHGTDGQKYFCQTELAPGVSLLVQRGDLTQFPVQVVVNAANEELRLIGGLSAALSEAAGPELQADCDRIVKKKGQIPPGRAIISKAGKLPYSHVIHAVVPRWKRDDELECMFQLERTVKKSLNLAEKFQYQSIAIPAIGSGIFGFPLPNCVVSIVLAIKESFQYNRDGHTLKEIYLVDLAEETIEAFVETVKMAFKNALPGIAPLPSVPAEVQPGLRKDDGSTRMLPCPGGLRVLLVEGEVQNATTDVVVNSIPWDLDLNGGPLSQALLAKAGPDLQKELNTAGQGMAVDVGTVLQTSGCNLPCHQVLHVVAPPWNKGKISSHKIMEDIIRECLTITENLSLKSIAFPAIGTGNLGFPKTIFAELVISEVFKFGNNNQPGALQEVHFLLHPDDHTNIQAFSDEFDRRANGTYVSDKIPKVENTQDFYGTVTSPTLEMHEMKIGPITFQVAYGDITKEEADVIVNSTSKTFNLKAGVSKAILEQAGQNVETECSRLAQQGNDDYIITEGGLLKCKNIIHVIGGNKVKKSVSRVLQECEKRNYSSVCLPAIGTGNAQQDPDKVANAIIDAIEGCILRGLVRSVKKIKVVVLLPELLNVFYTNMKKRAGFYICPLHNMLLKFGSCLRFSKRCPPKQKPLAVEKKTNPVIIQADATKDNRKTADDKIKNQSYTVDLKSCVATDAKGHSLPVQRLTKSEVEIPAHWTDMKQQDVCLVKLQPSHAEYDTVANAFNLTCSNFKIKKIERIQNPGLWKSYQTKKRNMDAKNSNTQNEKQLFHGTDAGTLPHVNQHGFNRSYAGKNGMTYGMGAYFAVNAFNSAHDMYAVPDVNGKKHMYYVRVLTGLYTRGQKSLIVPPPKNPQNPTDLYDTVTDNVQQPSLFVVFHDDHAYPEYLITFKQ